MVVRVGKPPSVPSYKFLVSACLAGINCTFNGKNDLKKSVKKLVDAGAALPVCPEVLGGLPIPRERSEIAGGSGVEVLAKKAKVVTVSGKDVSKNFIRGAKVAFRLAKRYKIKKAILKADSPSCGSVRIYDGTFGGVLRKGEGVLTSLLRLNKITIYTQGR